MTIVLHRHIRELGYCNRGARAFFVQHRLDWPAFLRGGISAEQLERTGDAMALKAVERARAEQAERFGNGR
ncbi:hypothetical protein [Caldimonas sp. KR1-144]|uniref:hypothetical protein n=1 Tax=Caldimonas sp. KR1-144 TaxID=3400911 RepID=UPI003BFDA77F